MVLKSKSSGKHFIMKLFTISVLSNTEIFFYQTEAGFKLWSWQICKGATGSDSVFLIILFLSPCFIYVFLLFVCQQVKMNPRATHRDLPYQESWLKTLLLPLTVSYQPETKTRRQRRDSNTNPPNAWSDGILLLLLSANGVPSETLTSRGGMW